MDAGIQTVVEDIPVADGAQVQLEVDLGVLLQKALEQVVDEDIGLIEQADLDVAGGLVTLGPDLLVGMIQHGNDVLQAVVILQPHRGHGQPAGRAGQQLHIQLCLEILYASAHIGTRNIQRVGGTGKAPELHHRQKQLEIVDLHLGSRLFISLSLPVRITLQHVDCIPYPQLSRNS